MISIGNKIKFAIIGALFVLCLARLNLHGTGQKYDLYRYFIPLIVGGLSGFVIGLMKDRGIKLNT